MNRFSDTGYYLLVSTPQCIVSIPKITDDYSNFVKFLKSLQNAPIWYNLSEAVIERSIYEFRRIAGSIGFVRYAELDNGNAYYIAKANIYGQPAIVFQTISEWSPCNRAILYGDTTIDDLFESIYKELDLCT